jgi:hypothetical protein
MARFGSVARVEIRCAITHSFRGANAQQSVACASDTRVGSLL